MKLFKKSYIEISDYDYGRLLRTLAQQRKAGVIKRSRLSYFRYLIANSMLVAVRVISPRIVTMNTDFIVRTAAGQALRLRLVYPEQECRRKGHISVFSWMGMSLLGRKAGDQIRKGITVEQIVYQPEINNAFHL